jgi:hypothetical protein
MNDIFTIVIDGKSLEIRKLNFKNYLGAYEIWKKSKLQFILVHDTNRNTNHAWNVDYTESSKVSPRYIDKIITAIDAHNY